MKPNSLVPAFIIYGLVALFPLWSQQSDPVSEDASTIDEAPVGVEEIITASEYFDEVSAAYAEIEDYEARLIITYPDTVDTIMTGILSHKRPDMLLIEFDDPADMVISVDGVDLQVYIPYLNVVMKQRLDRSDDSPEGLTAGVSRQGLELMKSRYSVAYLDSQNFVPLEEGSDEMVRKLKLEWKSIDEGFRELILSIGDDKLIRRIEAVTAERDEMILDFLDISINPGFPNQKFVWDSPPSANIIYDFIFEPEITEEE